MNFSDRFWHAAMKDDGLPGRSGWKLFTMREETTRQLRLAPSLDGYLAGLSSDSRRMVRRHRRKFFAEPAARLEQLSDPDDAGRLLEWIDRVNCDSWQAKTFGGEKENTAARKRLLEQVAAQGWLRSYVLLLGDEPVAFKHNYQYRGTMFSQGTAYRSQYGNLSPGVVLTFCIVDDIHTDRNVDVWDFGFGDLPYKRTFCNESHRSAVVYFVPRGRWRLLFHLQLTMNALYDRVRAAVVRLKIDKYVRKLLKRQQ
jgi:CelD/BcsL family acetyltransferase involved in cellulose biosynthesis